MPSHFAGILDTQRMVFGFPDLDLYDWVEPSRNFPLASFRFSRHITRQFSSSLAPERNPAMSRRHFLPNAAVLVLWILCASVAGSDLGHSPKLKTALIPRKASSARERSSEVVQRTPDVVLWDGAKKIV